MYRCAGLRVLISTFLQKIHGCTLRVHSVASTTIFHAVRLIFRQMNYMLRSGRGSFYLVSVFMEEESLVGGECFDKNGISDFPGTLILSILSRSELSPKTDFLAESDILVLERYDSIVRRC